MFAGFRVVSKKLLSSTLGHYLLADMFELEELYLVAYKKERASSRRLAKHSSISEHAALVRTLEVSAGTQSLGEFVDVRRKERARADEAQSQRKQARADALAARLNRPVAREAFEWHAWFDGSAYPNPGKIGIGGVLESPDGERTEISALGGHGDSCKAEYLALIAVLEAAVSREPRKLVIHGDSRVVIDDVLGGEARSAPVLLSYALQARELIQSIERFGNVELKWIPRARNGAADGLSRGAVVGGG
jgi:ribonuclease HI